MNIKVAILSWFVVSFLLTGCVSKEEEAKRLGFDSVEEMMSIHSKGWHSREKYEDDIKKLYAEGKKLVALGDKHEGVRKLSTAADNDHPEAQYELASLYKYGIVVNKDLGKAFELYLKSANSGVVRSMYEVSLSYYNGIGVSADLSAAYAYASKAAAAGDSDAQFRVGFHLAEGDGVEKDVSSAISWLGKSAASGNTDAMLKLGLIYGKGLGIKKDVSIAKGWLSKAASSGRSEATEILESLMVSRYQSVFACSSPNIDVAIGMAKLLGREFVSGQSYIYSGMLSAYSPHCFGTNLIINRPDLASSNFVGNVEGKRFLVVSHNSYAIGVLESREMD